MSEKKILYSLDGVNKIINDGYGQERKIINNIDLKIYESDFFGIRGKSGSGKSTLLNILGCIDDISSGSIIYRDRNISSFKKEQKSSFLLREIGFVFQSFHLIEHLNVFENIAVPLRLSGRKQAEIKQRVKLCLQSVGLDDKILMQFPRTLSGGEKQRVTIARAIINAPRVILADEPTGSLDSYNESLILDLLQKIHSERKGVTVILVSHSTNVINICSDIIDLADGKIINQYTALR